MVCAPLLVRYYALERTAIVIIISFAVFDDTAWGERKRVCSQVIQPVVNLLQKSHFFQDMSACVEKY